MRYVQKLLLALSAALFLLPACSSAASPGFGAFGLHRHHGNVSFSPPVNPTYDTSIGNGVDANGFASLPLRSGAHAYFVNSSTGNDANSCAQATSASTPKATLAAGVGCVVQGNGDQVLLAEGTTYAEQMPYIGTATKDGFSALYPTVISSYNPADPTNTSEYGRGDQRGDRPVITGARTTNISNQGPNYFVIKGLDFNPGNVSNTLLGFSADGTVPHAINYVLFENNILRYTGISIDESGPDDGTSAAWPGSHVIIRNNSLYSMWASTDAVHIGGVFAAGISNVTLEDNVFYHNGWNEAVTRGTGANTGGPTVFNHSYYIQTSTTNDIIRRNLSMEGAGDGGIVRGDGVLTENLFIDNPAAIGVGGNPDSVTNHRPNGVTFDVSYNAIIGSDGVNTTTDLVSWGINTTDGQVGSSRIDHNLMVRALAMTGRNNSGFSNNTIFNQPSYAQYDHNLIYLWVGQSSQPNSYYAAGGSFPAQSHPSYDYNNWDGLAQGTNTNNGSTTFPNAYTEAQLYAALTPTYPSITDSASFVTYVINHPEAHVQRLARQLLFAGYGITAPTDTTAPVLSSPVGSASGTTATIGATTNEADGIFYGVAIAQSNTAPPTLSTPTPSSTGGTLAAGTYYYVVTALMSDGETLGSNEVTATTTGTTSSVPLTWSAVAGATGYNVYRGINHQLQTAYYAAGNVTSYTDTNATSTAGTPPTAPVAAQIKLGIDGQGIAAPAITPVNVSSAGALTGTATVTSGKTYKAYLEHEDTSSNQSNVVVSSAFTASAPAVTFDPAKTDATVTLSNGNLTATRADATGSTLHARGTISVTAGSFTVTIGALPGGLTYIGLDDGTETGYLGNSGNHSTGYRNDGTVWVNGANLGTGPTYTVGDVITVTRTSTTCTFKKNGVDIGISVTLTGRSVGTTSYPAVAFSLATSNGSAVTGNFSGW